MKKIIFLLIVCILTACSQDFLELYPETRLDESKFYKTQDDFILLANGCYTPMRDYSKFNHLELSEVRSDNAFWIKNRIDDGGFRRTGQIEVFQVNLDNDVLFHVWQWAYNGIYRCNKLITQLDGSDITWDNTSVKDRCAGEALFLRALYYFDLVRNWGGVPIVTKVITAKEAVGTKRSTEEQVYELIVDDLKAAASHFSNAMDVEENGRANWGAATALLGKVYLYLQNYSEAETQLKSVIDANKYSLLPNYGDLFNPSMKDFTETIFAIQYSEASSEVSQRIIFLTAPPESGGEVTGRESIDISKAGWLFPTEDLINAFDTANDLRFDESIKFWYGKDWDLVEKYLPYQAKYKQPVTAISDWCGGNVPILRYSDVLLMYAEVLNEQAHTSEAIPYVQQVRDRAGLTDPLTGLDQAALRTLIANERQVEFCFENQRWYDLKRTGKALEVMAAHIVRHKAAQPWIDLELPASYVLAAHKLLYPIPSIEITTNDLEQNPGW